MATWRVVLNGLKPIFSDNAIFPDLRIDIISVEFEEKYVINLDQKAKEVATEQYKGFCDFLAVSIERTDKRTGLNYNVYIDYKNPIGYPRDVMFYPLDEIQQRSLSALKQKIYSRFEKDPNLDGYFPTDMQFSFLHNSAALLYDFTGKILDHNNIKEVLCKLKRFYSNVSATDLIIIGAGKEKITIEELNSIKKILSQDTDKNASLDENTLWFETAELNQLLKQSPNLSIELLKTLLEWIAKNEDNKHIVNKLELIKIDNINKLNLIIAISSLRSILEIWESNSDEDKEEYWQNILQENSIILSQLFSYPVVLTKGKAYVGGKGIFNTNGNIVDFLLSNKLTRNSVLVEIKTPLTKLISTKYREGIFNISQELTGAIIQASMYKDSLLKEFKILNYNINVDFEVFNPACLVIAGNFQKENMNNEQKHSFEIFRSGLKDVQVITYDELFEKVRILLNLLGGN